ncbi:PREDICTED: retinoic acid receptor responder protein 3-like [Poecilia mexicana]|uniref:LRAT domain-containing protein n=1 Tax=Poecilia mexicana TaxID=48701 RepID=A0A3B3WZ79_9TELE|nr:PREDICTED: retinoic acid receptor responder protein 3-like [Poecilia mexicana]
MGSVSSSAANPEYQEGKHTDMNRKEPKPGDLIEIFRVGYKHWAIYIGSGFVVHLVVNGLGSSSSCSLPAPGEMGVVMKEKLEDVVGGDRWRINNYLDKKYKPQQIYAIVKQAVGFIGTRLPYNLVSSNCEHFATDLRYGKSTSLQVVKAGAGIGGTVAGLVLFTGGLLGILLNRR